MKTKLWIGIGLLVLVLIFSIQNAEVVTIRFLMWEGSLSRAVMVFVLFAAGVLSGLLLAAGLRRRPG